MKNFIVLFVLIILFSSCKDNSVSTQKDNGFSVKISVKNSNGNPVAGLRISSWNHLSLPVSLNNKSIISNFNPLKSTATIHFALPIKSFAELLVFETNGTLIDTLWKQQLQPGLYSCSWSINNQKPTRVYKYRLTAKDGGGAYLFRDSSYAVLWQPDADISILGWTDQNGSFETKDKLLFPNVIDLPPLIYTNVNGPDSLGIFSIRDTVTIVLSDTATHQSITFVKVINPGIENDIQLVWNTSLTTQNIPIEKSLTRDVIIRTISRIGKLWDWKLYQNYPNPFN